MGVFVDSELLFNVKEQREDFVRVCVVRSRDDRHGRLPLGDLSQGHADACEDRWLSTGSSSWIRPMSSR
jgi:hypothetical protein